MSDSQGKKDEMQHPFKWLSYDPRKNFGINSVSDSAALDFMERANDPSVEKLVRTDGTITIPPACDYEVGAQPLLMSLRSISKIYGYIVVSLGTDGVNVRPCAKWWSD